MSRVFTADFETSTDKWNMENENARVWAAARCDIDNIERVEYFNNLPSFMSVLEKESRYECNTYYFHNLKFDGQYILYYLFDHGFKFVESRKDLESHTFTALISDTGVWYDIEICFKKYSKNRVHKVKIYDSLKKYNMTVAEVAKTLGLPEEKGELDYDTYRPIGHKLTELEKDYIRRDVQIMARALRVKFEAGLNKMTVGSDALMDYKNRIGKDQFKKWFPILPIETDQAIRHWYKGAFTYANPKYTNMLHTGKGKIIGRVFDVNSLYAFVMMLYNLPYGIPLEFEGKYQSDEQYPLYCQMLRCNFKLKDGYLPTIQLKNNLSFIPTQYLTSSERVVDGVTVNDPVTLYLTNYDMELFFKHYDVSLEGIPNEVEYLGGFKFKSKKGEQFFGEYIPYWYDVKKQARVIKNKGLAKNAKDMLNSLYGKFALNPLIASKIPYIDDNGILQFKRGEIEDRDPIYIPMGLFITSAARHYTISHAQDNYDIFLYCDTDSLHLLGDTFKNLEIDNTKLGAWKCELYITKAYYIRSKSYIEEGFEKKPFIKEIKFKGKKLSIVNQKKIFKVTCAGLPAKCHNQVTFDNFRIGAVYKDKLTYQKKKGGVHLVPIEFKISA